MEEEYQGYQLSQTIDEFNGSVRSLSTLDQYLLVGSTDNTCKIYQFDYEKSSYAQLSKMEMTKQFIYSTHIYKRESDYFFAFAGKEKTIFICTKEGLLVNTIKEAHKGPINCLTSNDKYLISGSWDATCKLWDINTLEFVTVLKSAHHQYAVTCCALSNGDIVTGSQSGIICFWDKDDFHNKKNIEGAHGDIIRQIKEIPGNLSFITCSNDELLKSWEYEKGNTQTFKGHTGYVFDFVYDSQSLKLVSASDDRKVIVWDFQTMKIEDTILHLKEIWCCGLTPLGDVITGTGSGDGKLRIFTLDPSRYAEVDAINNYQKEVQNKGILKKPQQTAPQPYQFVSQNHFAGNEAFPAGEYDYIFDIEQEGVQMKLPYNCGQDPQIVAQTFISFYKLEEQQFREVIVNHIKSQSQKQQPLDQSNKQPKNNNKIQNSDHQFESQIYKLSETLDCYGSAVRSLSTLDQYLLVGSTDNTYATCKLWDINTLEFVTVLKSAHHQYAVTCCALSNGDIATGSQSKTICFWDKDDFHNKKNFEGAHGDIIRQIKQIPGNLSFITCSNDELLKSWEYEKGNTQTFKGHTGYVFDFVYDSQSLKLVSASDDRKVIIWNSSTMKIEDAILHPNTIWCCDFTPCGDIITGCGDGQLRIFSANKSQQIKQRFIQTQFKSQYFPDSQIVLFEQQSIQGDEISKALNAINKELQGENDKFHVPSQQQQLLDSLVNKLSAFSNQSNQDLSIQEIEILTEYLNNWPFDQKIQVIELNRIFLLHQKSVVVFTGMDKGHTYLANLLSNLTQKFKENLKLLTLRTLCNVFKHNKSTKSLFERLGTVLLQLQKSTLQNSQQQQTCQALASLLFNISIEVNNMDDQMDKGMIIQQYIQYLNGCLMKIIEPESQFKLLQSIGNVLCQVKEAKEQFQQCNTHKILEQIVFNQSAKNIKELEGCRNDLLMILKN